MARDSIGRARTEGAAKLFNKGVRLHAIGRSEDAIAVYDDLLARFGTATEPPLRELVAIALVNKGVVLDAIGRGDDAIDVYDDLLARFGTATELPLAREQVAKALVNKGVALGALGRSEDEIAVYDELLALFGTANELPLREQVAKALINKGIALGALGHSEDEIAVYDDLLVRFGMATELPLRESTASALFNKSVTLGALGHNEQAIAVYDDLIARFGTAIELPLREHVATALYNKGSRLGTLGRSENAITVYNELLARFGTATELPLREPTASALLNKGVTLALLDRSEDAIAVYDDLIARFGEATELPLREHVANALFNKGAALGALGRSEEAIAIYDDLLARFGTATELPLSEYVAKALFVLGRIEDAIAVYEDLIPPALREHFANALVQIGIELGTPGRSEDAIDVYDDQPAHFGTATEVALREPTASALLSKEVTLGSLARSNEAAIETRRGEVIVLNDYRKKEKRNISALRENNRYNRPVKENVEDGDLAELLRLVRDTPAEQRPALRQVWLDFRRTAKATAAVRPAHTQIELPQKAPVMWPGARQAPLIEFLQEHYGEYIGRGLTLKWIRRHDPRLCRGLESHKARGGSLPFNIPTQYDFVTAAIEKLRITGIEALIPKERTAVSRSGAARKAQTIDTDNYGADNNAFIMDDVAKAIKPTADLYGLPVDVVRKALEDLRDQAARAVTQPATAGLRAEPPSPAASEPAMPKQESFGKAPPAVGPEIPPSHTTGLFGNVPTSLQRRRPYTKRNWPDAVLKDEKAISEANQIVGAYTYRKGKGEQLPDAEHEAYRSAKSLLGAVERRRKSARAAEVAPGRRLTMG